MRVLMISADARMDIPGTEAYTRLELQKAQVKELRVILWTPQEPMALFEALGAAFARRFDTVTAQDPLWRGLLGLVAARIGGAYLQVQVHSDLSALPGYLYALAKFVLRQADMVRVVSEKIKKQVRHTGTHARVDILPVYVDLEAAREAPAAMLKQEFPQFGKCILFVGRLEEEKNPQGALEAFAEVVQEFPGAGLLVAGEGSLREELEELADTLGIGKRVVWLGYRTDLPSLYKSVDVMLVTSWHESWGASMVEALSLGLPVVAPDVGVAREAGAMVVARPRLARSIIEVLKSGARGALKIELFSKEEWASRWRQTLQP